MRSCAWWSTNTEKEASEKENHTERDTTVPFTLHTEKCSQRMALPDREAQEAKGSHHSSTSPLYLLWSIPDMIFKNRMLNFRARRRVSLWYWDKWAKNRGHTPVRRLLLWKIFFKLSVHYMNSFLWIVLVILTQRSRGKREHWSLSTQDPTAQWFFQ